MQPRPPQLTMSVCANTACSALSPAPAPAAPCGPARAVAAVAAARAASSLPLSRRYGSHSASKNMAGPAGRCGQPMGRPLQVGSISLTNMNKATFAAPSNVALPGQYVLCGAHPPASAIPAASGPHAAPLGPPSKAWMAGLAAASGVSACTSPPSDTCSHGRGSRHGGARHALPEPKPPSSPGSSNLHARPAAPQGLCVCGAAGLTPCRDCSTSPLPTGGSQPLAPPCQPLIRCTPTVGGPWQPFAPPCLVMVAWQQERRLPPARQLADNLIQRLHREAAACVPKVACDTGGGRGRGRQEGFVGAPLEAPGRHPAPAQRAAVAICSCRAAAGAKTATLCM